MDSQLQKDLDDLLSFVSPAQLRQSVIKIFFSFLTNAKTDLPNNFEKITEDILFLLIFLEKADKKREGN